MGKYKKFRHMHWKPACKKNENFPIYYDINSIPEEGVEDYLDSNKTDISIKYYKGDNLKDKIKEEIIKIFPFHKYADRYLDTYIGNSGDNDIKYSIDIKVFVKEEYINKNGKESIRDKHIKTWVVELTHFKTDYSFNLIRSMDQLKEVLGHNPEDISFDLETTGLNPETDKIVGVPFAIKEKEGYYIPINHTKKFKDFNLGKEALDYFYEVMTKAKRVFLFNARFDMRFMEFTDPKYDMSKINIIDVQITVWYVDPDYRKHDLKDAEKRYRGYYRIDLQDTMKASKVSGFNTARLSPENILFYGAQDGISTLEVGLDTYKYYKEFKLSGQIDMKLLYPLMKMENESIRIDMDYLKEQLDYIEPRLKEIEDLMYEQIGDVNLNSSPQKVALFESFGLDTGVKTKKGAMSTGKDAVDALINRLNNRGEDVPEWLTYMNERSHLQQLHSTFFNSLYEQAKMSDGRVRINYRNVQASTGRLSSGKELF